MTGVGIMLWRRSLRSYELHDLVLTFSRDGRIGNDNFHLNLFSNLLGKAGPLLRTFAHAGSVLTLYAAQYRKEVANLSMNGVPGVMALLSHVFFCAMLSANSCTSPFCDFSILANSALSSSFSLASCADRKRRDRC